MKHTYERKKVVEWCDEGAIPPEWNADSDFVFRMMGPRTIKALSLSPRDVVLDVACGLGIEVVGMAKQGARVVGVDVSKIMVMKAKRYVAGCGVEADIVQGASECLPFRDNAVDALICKGALDHFHYPRRSILEFARVLKPEGRAVISVANMESLGFKLARLVDALGLSGLREGERRPWDMPEDHTLRVDYKTLKAYTQGALKANHIEGLSLFWSFPHWGKLLGKMPKKAADTILNTLDTIARKLPTISDIIIFKGQPEKRKTINPSSPAAKT
ncbi:MAG: class I SAM-dependent methyltransferase [Candidatus Jordarchaeales archaeon]